jgi:hypothetical protein
MEPESNKKHDLYWNNSNGFTANAQSAAEEISLA